MTAEQTPHPGLMRLIYVSLAGTVTALSPEAVMPSILEASRRNNTADGLTGMLVSNSFWFVQVLEGAPQQVDACFDRIALDPRHRDMTVKSRTLVRERRFGGWSMCGLTLSRLDDGLLAPPEIEFNVWSASPEALLQMLSSLAERYAAELDAQHAQSDGSAK